MSSKVRNRKAVNERRVRFTFRRSLLSHEQGYIFVPAEIYFKGCIINVMEGFRTSIRILMRAVRQLKKNKDQSNKYIKLNYSTSVYTLELIAHFFRMEMNGIVLISRRKIEQNKAGVIFM